MFACLEPTCGPAAAACLIQGASTSFFNVCQAHGDWACTLCCCVTTASRALQAQQQADEEVGVAQLRVAEAEAAAEAAESGRNAAEAAAAAAQQQAAAARAEASRLGGEVASVRQAAEARSLDARQLLAAKDRCGVGWEGTSIMKENPA